MAGPTLVMHATREDIAVFKSMGFINISNNNNMTNIAAHAPKNAHTPDIILSGTGSLFIFTQNCPAGCINCFISLPICLFIKIHLISFIPPVVEPLQAPIIANTISHTGSPLGHW